MYPRRILEWGKEKKVEGRIATALPGSNSLLWRWQRRRRLLRSAAVACAATQRCCSAATKGRLLRSAAVACANTQRCCIAAAKGRRAAAAQGRRAATAAQGCCAAGAAAAQASGGAVCAVPAQSSSAAGAGHALEHVSQARHDVGKRGALCRRLCPALPAAGEGTGVACCQLHDGARSRAGSRSSTSISACTTLQAHRPTAFLQQARATSTLRLHMQQI